MATVFDVAKYILTKKECISTWKLQKLCYYAQAWSLAWTEKPLFEEEFEAWVNGPVCPALFNEHRGCFNIRARDLRHGDEKALSDDEKDTIDVVLKDYGDMEPYELRELTHTEEPWRNARSGVPDNAYCSNVITKDSMGSFYGGL